MAELARFLTVGDVADLLHCRPATVRKMIDRGELAGRMVARIWLIPASEITRLERMAFSSARTGKKR